MRNERRAGRESGSRPGEAWQHVTDAIVIGGGAQRPVTAAYLAQAGRGQSLLEAPPVAGRAPRPRGDEEVLYPAQVLAYSRTSCRSCARGHPGSRSSTARPERFLPSTAPSSLAPEGEYLWRMATRSKRRCGSRPAPKTEPRRTRNCKRSRRLCGSCGRSRMHPADPAKPD